MREILFRGKRTHDGKWVYGDYTSYCQLDRIYAHDDFRKIVWFVDRSTVSRFTGLTDKNGTKIFEGDIVNLLCEVDEIGVIACDVESARFVIHTNGFTTDFDHCYGTDLEVIGNIHDNQELLEDET